MQRLNKRNKGGLGMVKYIKPMVKLICISEDVIRTSSIQDDDGFAYEKGISFSELFNE